MASSRRHGDPRDAHLAETVSRLRTELDGLRRKQRSQAIIEQAKGLLAGRLNCSPDKAFEHLAAMSQHTNMKVVEVAAGLIGVAAPVTVPPTQPPAPHADTDLGVPWNGLGGQSASTTVSLPPELTARYHLTCAAMADAADANELAEIVWADGVQQLGAHAVMLTVIEPDGAVRLVGAHGLPAPVVSAWHRVPGSLRIAFLRTAAEGRPWWINRAEAAALGYEFIGGGQMRACLPMRQADQVLGVAVVMWPETVNADDATRAYLQTLADAAGRRLSPLLSTADGYGQHVVPAAHWIDTVLQAMPGSVALLGPIRDDDGGIVDWCLQRCSPDAVDASGRAAAQLTGRRLLELYPHAPLKAVFAGYRDALVTGKPFEAGPFQVVETADPRPVPVTVSLRAARFGAGLLVSWRYHDHDRLLTDRLDRMQRAGDMGWAEWDLVTGRTGWAPQTYEILRRDPHTGPLKLNGLHRYVHPDDVDAFHEAVRVVSREAQPVDLRVRFRRHGNSVAVRLMADAVCDADGRVVAVHAVLRRLSSYGEG